MATRYKVTKEQVEKLVENFVMEAASPEAKKYIKGTVPHEKYGQSVKTTDCRTGSGQAPEAKKYVKGSVTGGDDMVEDIPNSPRVTKEVEPGSKKDELKQSPEAKKYVKGSVSENRKRRRRYN